MFRLLAKFSLDVQQECSAKTANFARMLPETFLLEIQPACCWQNACWRFSKNVAGKMLAGGSARMLLAEFLLELQQECCWQNACLRFSKNDAGKMLAGGSARMMLAKCMLHV